MSYSIKTANELRNNIIELVDRLYKTNEGLDIAKKQELVPIIEELMRLSQTMILNTVSDALTIENFY